MSQPSIHTRPRAPVTTNEPRQPMTVTSQPTNTAPIAGPANGPALRIAIARPRSERGAHSRTTRPPAGYVAASPAPKPSRVSSSAPKFVAAPVSIAATDQTPMLSAVVNRVPQRSTASPVGIKKTTYVHRNDENTNPSATGERWNACARGFAAIDKLIRST